MKLGKPFADRNNVTGNWSTTIVSILKLTNKLNIKRGTQMNLLKPISSAVIAGSVLLAFMPTSAHAQESLGLALEEIIVTAQRRAQSLQDVPISVSVVTDDFIVENDIRSLQDLNGTVPGFYATNSVNYGAAPLSIRGIGGANGGGNFFNDEPVAVYVDDVYISRLSFSTADLIDVDSIQVLRGPQGTLYGRNSTAGALLLRTARPTEEFEGYAKLGIAEHGETRVSGAISGSLSDNFQARLAVGYSDRDGWGTNTVDGSDIGGSDETTGRLSLRYRPSDSFSADLILETQDRSASPATIALANVAPLTPSTPFVLRSDLDAVLDSNSFALNDPSANDSDSSSATLLLNWQFGNVTLDSVTAFRSYELIGAQDSDGTQFTLFNNSGLLDSDQFSQELRLSSTTSDKFSWVVGAYFLTEDVIQDFTINNFQGLFGAGTSATVNATQDTDAYALFADVTWSLTDNLELILGARYSDETKDFTNALNVRTIRSSIPLPIPFGPFPPGARIPGGIPVSPPAAFAQEADFDDFTPRIVFNYRFNDNLTGYASYSQSFKSGGFNSFGLTPAFDNEEIDAFEIGFKSTLADGRATLNGAIFSYDYTNLQVRLPVPTGGVNIQNAGEADVQGAELELAWAVSDRFKLAANVAFLDTELNEFITQEIPENLIFLIGAPIPLNNVNAAGNELTRAPDIQYYISADYEFSLSENLIANLLLNYRFQDDVFFLETNQGTNTFRSDSSDEVGIRLTIKPASERWELGLFGQNIGDERTITQVTALGGHPNAAISEPSKWGIDFKLNF